MIAHLRVPGNCPHNFTIDPAADVPDVFAHDAAGDDDADAGDGGANAVDIGVGQAVLKDVALAAFIGDLLFLGGFDAAEDDVLAAEVFDVFLGLEAGAFADGQHGDDRADAEHNAKHGQHGTQLVQPEALDPQPHDAFEPGQGTSAGHADGRGRIY